MRLAPKKVLAVVLVAVVSSLGRADAQETQSADLKVTLLRVQPESPKPLFQVELRNVSDHPLILNLGIMLANGQRQYTDAVTLSLADGHGKTLPLELLGPGGVAGAVSSLVVPLPKGATFTLPVDLADYVSPKQDIWQVTLTPGKYTLQAAYAGVALPQQPAKSDMQDISHMAYWTGAVRSNTVTFMVSTTVDYPHAK